MTFDACLTFARRWAALALLSMPVLWGWWFWQNYQLWDSRDWTLDRISYTADHLAFYTGARLTYFGPEDKLYDYKFVGEYQADLFIRDPANPKNDVWQWLEAFRNPPFYAMLYWPTCGLKYAISATIWIGISFLLTLLGTWWVTGGRRYWRSVLWVFSFLPTYAAFDYGQNPPVSFALFAATFWLLSKNRPFAAGLVAGFLLFKPQLLLGLGIWALFDLRRLWPCALGAIVTGIALAGVSYLVLPVASENFVETFQRNREFENFDQYKMHNPLAFARLLLPKDSLVRQWPEVFDERLVRRIHNITALTMALAAVAAFWLLYRRRGDDVAVMFGGAVFLTLFAGPHALIYEWMLLAITGLLWVKEWRDRPNTWFALYACAWGVLYFSTDLNDWLLNDEPKYVFGYRFMTHWPATVQWSVPVLGMVGWYAVALLTKPRNDPADA